MCVRQHYDNDFLHGGNLCKSIPQTNTERVRTNAFLHGPVGINKQADDGEKDTGKKIILFGRKFCWRTLRIKNNG